MRNTNKAAIGHTKNHFLFIYLFHSSLTYSNSHFDFVLFISDVIIRSKNILGTLDTSCVQWTQISFAKILPVYPLRKQLYGYGYCTVHQSLFLVRNPLFHSNRSEKYFFSQHMQYASEYLCSNNYHGFCGPLCMSLLNIPLPNLRIV